MTDHSADGKSVPEPDVLGFFETYSNTGRWGGADELGTLNLVTAAHRVKAARLVEHGTVVSLSHPLSSDSGDNFVHRMLPSSGVIPSASDRIEIAPHGYRITHMDALGHVSHGGSVYNGRAVSEAITPDGLAFGSIFALRGGIVTRGILLDVAEARGVPFLRPDDVVEPGDLDRAAALYGTPIEPGDAVLVRVGLGAREAVEGPEDPTHRAGLSPLCVGWLSEHEVALYGGDCIEYLPSGYPGIPLPFHALALSSMGLAILDNVDMEALREACVTFRRNAFLLVISPLAIPGGTGSAVNPLAIF